MYIMPGDLDKLAFCKRDEDTWLAGSSGWHHRTFQVPQNGGILTYISRMDTADVREKTTPKIAEHKVQETLHFGYLKLLVMATYHFANLRGRPFATPETQHWCTMT